MNQDNISTEDDDVRYVKINSKMDYCAVGHESRYLWLGDNFDLKDKVILDFGCGTGYGVDILARDALEVDGIDYSKKTIQFAKNKYKKPNIKFYTLDACSSKEVFTKLKPKKYDMIVSFDVIEHLEKYFDYLENIQKLIKKDGILIIGCPNRLVKFDWSTKWNKYHLQEFTPYQLRKILSFYFNDIKLVSQDFSDCQKKEQMRQIASSNGPGQLKNQFKKIIPKFVKEPLKKLLKDQKKSECQISDIKFEIEPGEKKLNSAVGVMAICQDPKV